MIVFALCCSGCDGAAEQPTEYDFPTALPIWIVEDDPKVTIYDRKDLERDRKVGKMLVIPLYRYYEHEGTNDFLAIAHPFVYQQGEDIEKQLASFGQRDKVRALTFWVPGYFPDSIGTTFPWVSIINGKRMVVVELQRCIGSEESQINAAMKTLLEGDFVVGNILPTPPPPPYTNEPKMTNVPYDASRVVRSEYSGRFYHHQASCNVHVLWAFPPGTRIINRLSAEEKKTVAEFAASTTPKADKQVHPVSK
jgi:hypothetical protein